MTIKEYILKVELLNAEHRLQKLTEIKAPAIMIEKQGEFVTELSQGVIKIGGNDGLLKQEVVSVEPKRGVGGKPYFIFNGDVKYFPVAKYGRFINR